MTISTSVLCPHIEQGSGIGWLTGLAVRPKAVKLFSPNAAQEVKHVDPDIKTVVRRYVADQGSYLREGEAGGERFVREIGNLAGVDILEGLNECTSFDDANAMRAANAFHVGFVRACQTRGVTPCVLNIAVGNPREDLVHLLSTCVERAIAVGGYVGYHSYGPRDLLSAEEFYANRGPLKLAALLRAAGVQAPIRWLYTEAGWDTLGGSQASGPWRDLQRRGYLTMDQARAQMQAYEARVRALGVEMAFQYTFWGTSEWRDYEYTTSADWMNWFAEHWRANVFQPPPPPPPPPAPTVLYITAPTYANLRSAPSMDASTDIGDLYRGTPVEVVERAGEWYHVRVQAVAPVSRRVVVFGWVHQSVVSASPPSLLTLGLVHDFEDEEHD
jgi:hypothetical protein